MLKHIFQEKLKLRLKTLEEVLKNASSFSIDHNGSLKNAKSSNFFGILSSNTKTKKRSTSQPRGSTITKSAMQMLDEKQTTFNSEMKPVNSLKMKNPTSESLVKKSLWASRNKVIDNSGKENAETNKIAIAYDKIQNKDEVTEMENRTGVTGSNKETKDLEKGDIDDEDMVSGVLYDRLQKEVIHLRKSSDIKDMTLNSKDEEIKVWILLTAPLSLRHTIVPLL